MSTVELAKVQEHFRAQLEAELLHLIGPARGEPEPRSPDRTQPTALDRLCLLLGLSTFERALIVLCAGVELDGRAAKHCRELHEDAARGRPTFGLALAHLPGPHWSATSPDAPLRGWCLLDLAPGTSVTGRELTLDERVLHHLLGVPASDPELAGLLRQPRSATEPTPSQVRLGERIARLISSEPGAANAPVPCARLVSHDRAASRAVLSALCARLLMPALDLDAGSLPVEPTALHRVARRIAREQLLTGALLVVDCARVDARDQSRAVALESLLAELALPVILLAGPDGSRPSGDTPVVSFEVERSSHTEQVDLWMRALGTAVARIESPVRQLAGQFHLGPSSIRDVVTRALAEAPSDEDPDRLARRLWTGCRSECRGAIEQLAQRISSGASWGDLILPPDQQADLQELAAQVKNRARVHEEWGFAGSRRGLGLAALFSGSSGTGKTLAAEVVANALELDLYRIDLSAVVSKYIGETEKNLRGIFDAAESGGAVLLFDEADALFGKRSRVKDSHDRYANIEISYLLQRIESYRGLAILTTNLKDSLDPAFLRRLQFVVDFPFPDQRARAEIWRRSIPAAAIHEGLDFERLADLQLAGGSIRNAALRGAFLAADEPSSLRMRHLIQAARRECEKMAVPVTVEDGAR